MTRDSFVAGMQRLRANFSRSPIPPDVADTLYAEVSTIPNQAWLWIVSEAIRTLERWPANFAKDVLTLHKAWISINPQASPAYTFRPCRNCYNSSGYLWATKYYPDLDYFATAVFRCSHCDNARGTSSIPRYTLEEIRELGYEPETIPVHQGKDVPCRQPLPLPRLKTVEAHQFPDEPPF